MKPKKTKKAFEDYLLKVINKCIPVLLLQKYTIEVRISEIDDWDKRPDFDSGYFGNLFNYPYLNAIIIYSKEALDDWIEENTDMAPYIIHEMCHIITDPLYSIGNKRYVSKEALENERELLTDHICNIVLKGLL
jgi:hypothetical protein